MFVIDDSLSITPDSECFRLYQPAYNQTGSQRTTVLVFHEGISTFSEDDFVPAKVEKIFRDTMRILCRLNLVDSGDVVNTIAFFKTGSPLSAHRVPSHTDFQNPRGVEVVHCSAWCRASRGLEKLGR